MPEVATPAAQDTTTASAPVVASTPSPTPAADVPAGGTPKTLSSMTPEERHNWRLTGDVPNESAKPADSPTAKPAEQATPTGVTKADPASETGEPVKSKTEARFQELLSDRAAERDRADAAERRLAELEGKPKTDASAGSSPAAATLQDVLDTPDLSRAPMNDSEFFAQFPDANYGDFGRYTARYEIAHSRATEQQRVQHEQHQQTIVQRATGFETKLKAAQAADPNFMASISPEVNAMRPVDMLGPNDRITAANVMAQVIIQSDAPEVLMRHLSTAGKEEFAKLSALPPTQAAFMEIARRLGSLEARLTSGTTPAASAPPKTVSDAPEPPLTVNGAGTKPADPVEGAIRDKDFRRFMRAENERDLKGR